MEHDICLQLKYKTGMQVGDAWEQDGVSEHKKLYGSARWKPSLFNFLVADVTK